MKTFSINDYKFKVDIDEHFIYFYSSHSFGFEREMHSIVPKLGKVEYFWFWIATNGWIKGAERWRKYMSKYPFWSKEVESYLNEKIKSK